METLKGLEPEEETSVWMRTQQHASRDVDVRYGLSTSCAFKTRDIPLILCTYVHNQLTNVQMSTRPFVTNSSCNILKHCSRSQVTIALNFSIKKLKVSKQFTIFEQVSTSGTKPAAELLVCTFCYLQTETGELHASVYCVYAKLSCDNQLLAPAADSRLVST